MKLCDIEIALQVELQNMIVDSNFIPLHVATENSHVEMITF